MPNSDIQHNASSDGPVLTRRTMVDVVEWTSTSCKKEANIWLACWIPYCLTQAAHTKLIGSSYLTALWVWRQILCIYLSEAFSPVRLKGRFHLLITWYINVLQPENKTFPFIIIIAHYIFVINYLFFVWMDPLMKWKITD